LAIACEDTDRRVVRQPNATGAVLADRNTCNSSGRPGEDCRNPGGFPAATLRLSRLEGPDMPLRPQGRPGICGPTPLPTPTAFLPRRGTSLRNPPAEWPEYSPRRIERSERRPSISGRGQVPMQEEDWRSAKGTRQRDRASRRSFLSGCWPRSCPSDIVARNGNERQAAGHALAGGLCHALPQPCPCLFAPERKVRGIRAVFLSTIAGNDRLVFHSLVLGLAPQSPIS